MGIFGTIFTAPQLWVNPALANVIQISKLLVESARLEVSAVLEKLETTPNGLSSEQVYARIEQYGFN